MKTCSTCRQPKPISDFGKAKANKDGLEGRCRECVREYMRAYNQRPEVKVKRFAQRAALPAEERAALNAASRARYVEKKDQDAVAKARWLEANSEKMGAYYRDRGREFREWVDRIKSTTPCLDCGGVFKPYVMEFDHIKGRGQKRCAIGNMSNHKRERVLAEMAKCDLVCCNCHRIRTHKRRKPARTDVIIRFRGWLDQQKAKSCKDCGGSFHPQAMDFDHVQPGSKNQNVSNMAQYSRARVLEEIGKCDLVCANCHRERTVKRLRGAREDATPTNCVSCGDSVWGYEPSACNVKCKACRKTPLKHRKGGDTDELVSCRLCSLQRRQLLPHLKSAHGLSKAGYLEQFPDALVEVPGIRTKSPETRAKMSKSGSKRWSNPEARKKASENARSPWKDKKLTQEHRDAISRGLSSTEKRLGRQTLSSERDELGRFSG